MEKNIVIDIRQHEQLANATEQTIGIIGLGNMGAVTVRALVDSGFVNRDHFLVSNRTSEGSYEKLARQSIDTNSITIVESNDEVVRRSDVIILTIKPQQLQEELLRWREKKLLRPDQLVVSFAAGVRTEKMKDCLGNKKQPIARAMPNVLVQIGRGFTGWFISDDATIAQENYLRAIIKALGKNDRYLEEEKIDAVTADTGSGPAIACRFAEEMTPFVMDEEGVSEKEAEDKMADLFIGIGLLREATGWSFAEIRRRITSKNGTTEAAMRAFDHNNLGKIVRAGMSAAHARAREMSQEFDAKT